MIRRLAVLMLFWITGGCAAQGASTTARPSPQLTWANPVAQLELGPAPAGSAIIALSIGAVHNPEREPVSIQVSLVDPAVGTSPVPVSTVSLFPSDRPGRFIIRVPHRTAATEPGLLVPGSRRILIVALSKSVDQLQSPLLVIEELRAEWITEPRKL